MQDAFEQLSLMQDIAEDREAVRLGAGSDVPLPTAEQQIEEARLELQMQFLVAQTDVEIASAARALDAWLASHPTDTWLRDRFQALHSDMPGPKRGPSARKSA